MQTPSRPRAAHAPRTPNAPPAHRRRSTYAGPPHLNPSYRLHRPFHRLRYAHAVFDDEIGESIVGTRYERLTAVFGSPKRVPADDRSDRHCPLYVYYDVVNSHGMRAGSEWQFCIARGRVKGAFDGSPSDHRPSAG